MNQNHSQTQPHPQSNDEPRIRASDYIKASALVVGACASIAIGFTLIATCYAVDDTITRIFRKGDRRHVPR